MMKEGRCGTFLGPAQNFFLVQSVFRFWYWDTVTTS